MKKTCLIVVPFLHLLATGEGSTEERPLWIAVSLAGHVVGLAEGRSEEEARALALRECARRHKTECQPSESVSVNRDKIWVVVASCLDGARTGLSYMNWEEAWEKAVKDRDRCSLYTKW